MSTPLEGEPPAVAPQATIPAPPPEALVVARQLAAVLGEQEEKPIIQIARVVATLGQDKATALSEEALKVAAGEGILTKDKRPASYASAHQAERSSRWCVRR